MKTIKSKGFTLVEVIAVVAILGVIFGIAVLSVMGIIEKSRRDVCNVNALEFERMYESYLDLNRIELSDGVFVQYLNEYGSKICPSNGEISYVDGKVRCSLHPSEGGGSDSGGEEEVPYL